jgi:hypothetical protein
LSSIEDAEAFCGGISFTMVLLSPPPPPWWQF